MVRTVLLPCLQKGEFINMGDKEILMTEKKKRPELLTGTTWAVNTGCGKIYVTLNWFENKPFEVFLLHGKAGGCAFAQCETIGRLISYSLRTNGDINEIIKQLKGIRCHNISEQALSCADATAKVLEKNIKKGDKHGVST